MFVLKVQSRPPRTVAGVIKKDGLIEQVLTRAVDVYRENIKDCETQATSCSMAEVERVGGVTVEVKRGVKSREQNLRYERRV